jgi:16S rRNA processing protein RimM
MDGVDVVYLGTETQRYEVQSSRLHQENLLLRLVGCEDRISADALRGMKILIEAGDVDPLPPDEYYIHELVGLDVVDEHGKLLGELVEVIVTGANDVYRVVCGQNEILLPAIKEVIRAVGVDAGEMTVRLLPGMR